MARFRRAAYCGNALMEYVVPTVIILIVAGVLTMLGSINTVIDDYFARASGSTPAGTMQMQSMGSTAGGSVGSGSMSNFGSVSN